MLTADPCHNRCCACGRPEGRLVWVDCGECFHPYLTPIGIVFHDWKMRWRFYCWAREDKFEPLPFKFSWWFRAAMPRRRKSILVCPCCVHDINRRKSWLRRG